MRIVCGISVAFIRTCFKFLMNLPFTKNSQLLLTGELSTSASLTGSRRSWSAASSWFSSLRLRLLLLNCNDARILVSTLNWGSQPIIELPLLLSFSDRSILLVSWLSCGINWTLKLLAHLLRGMSRWSAHCLISCWSCKRVPTLIRARTCPLILILRRVYVDRRSRLLHGLQCTSFLNSIACCRFLWGKWSLTSWDRLHGTLAHTWLCRSTELFTVIKIGITKQLLFAFLIWSILSIFSHRLIRTWALDTLTHSHVSTWSCLSTHRTLTRLIQLFNHNFLFMLQILDLLSIIWVNRLLILNLLIEFLLYPGSIVFISLLFDISWLIFPSSHRCSSCELLSLKLLLFSF